MKITIDKELLKSVISLASVIEARDPYTGGHTWRVSQYAVKLAKKAQLSHDEVFILHLGGIIHDLGKIGISDAVLLKPDALTDDEYEVMKRHPNIGYDLIQSHPLFNVLVDSVFMHHERVDGRGYPNKESGSQFSTTGRIMAIADAFDAMTSTRPYRKGMPPEKAINILNSEKDKQFDGALVELFTELYEGGALEHILGHGGDGRKMLTCDGCGPIIVPNIDSKDGDHVVCPSCHGEYLLTRTMDQYALTLLGKSNTPVVPTVDNYILESFLQDYSELIEINV